MYPCSAFVSLLALSSGISSSNKSKDIVKPVEPRENVEPLKTEYPKMLECGPRGECPKGSMCLKLIGKYGVCVVQKP